MSEKQRSDSELIGWIMKKPQYAELPRKDVEMVFKQFKREKHSDEEIKKLVREKLRMLYSSFSGKKLFLWKGKSADDVLKKHLSTRERYKHYEEIYSQILNNLPGKISVVDLGAGVNGFSYDYFKKIGFDVDYLAVEAIGQLVDLMQEYFEREKIPGKSYHGSLFDQEFLKEIIAKTKKPRVVFLFKVLDSLESVERNYSHRLIDFLFEKCGAERIVISFATRSMFARRKFYINRKWLTDFLQEKYSITDDFDIGGERYIVVGKG
jgi:hypothetical protein